jgi:Zn-dependent protease
VDVVTKLLFVLVFIPAVVFHEVAHGYVANMLGDPTAKNAGRLSLNPIRHVDPIGTVLMPALLLIFTGFVFGYAKPVPIDPRYFKNFRVGMLLTGLAGPATNLVFAIVSGLVILLLGGMPSHLMNGMAGAATPLNVILTVLFLFYWVNLILMFVNLIPIPPLDGSRVLPIFLTDAGIQVYAKVEQYGLMIVIGLIVLFPTALSAYFNVTVYALLNLVVHP